jgi:glycine cleavage system H protein
VTAVHIEVREIKKDTKIMSTKIDTTLRYQKTHEWARLDGSEVVVGISDHAQDALSDLVFVDLPSVGSTLARGDRFGTVESVKAASDVYMPVSGTITATNVALEKTPEAINQDPYNTGWLIRVRPDNAADLDSLLDAAAYGQYLSEEEH